MKGPSESLHKENIKNHLQQVKPTDILTSTFIAFRSRLGRLAAEIAGAEEADDVIHDAFCSLWSHHPRVEDETEALRLTYTAVRNSAIDSYRRSSKRQTVSIDDLATTLDADDKNAEQDRQDTYNAVIRLGRKALNSRQFEILELHDIKGLGYEDVAEKLGMTQENVRMTLSRARKIIRDLYKKQAE